MRKEKELESGVYIALLVDHVSKVRLNQFCLDMNIDLSESKPIFKDKVLDKTLHSSLIFSKNGDYENVNIVDQFKRHEGVLTAKPDQWSLAHSKSTGSKILTLRLDAPNIVALHNEIKEAFNLTHLFDDYTPHISLHYDFQGDEVPEVLPDFEIKISGYHIKKLEHKSPAHTKSTDNAKCNRISI